MTLKTKIAGVSALALMLGMSASAMAGGLSDYLDDGDGYDDSYVAADTAPADDGVIAADDDGDLFAAAAPVQTAPSGPDMDGVDDDQLAALDEEPDCNQIGNLEADSENDNQGELTELGDAAQTSPCQVSGSGDQNLNDTNSIAGGSAPSGPAQSVALVQVGDLNNLGAQGDEGIDSLLQVNVGTADRTGPNSEGQALIEVGVLDGVLTGNGENGSGALQVTVLDVLNGDGQLLDTDPSGGALGPLQALGAVAAIGLDPAPGGATGPENLGGLAEVNIGDDFDGSGDFNLIQANAPLGPLEPLVTDTLGIEQIAVLNLIGQGGDVLTPIADINGALGMTLGPLLGFGGDAN